MSAKALEFTILTAARTGETVHATWAEMDLEARVWVVPANRMKSRRPHRVPLTEPALAVLEAVKPPGGYRPTSWVFPSLWRRGKPLSTAAMERMLQDLGYGERATVHGFRSTFRDWAGDCTNFAKETIEAALAHVVGDETERAYRRGDALLKRRKLMEAWAGFWRGRRGTMWQRSVGRASADPRSSNARASRRCDRPPRSEALPIRPSSGRRAVWYGPGTRLQPS
jgi:integrase